MPLRYAPTLVIGIDSGGGVKELMKQVWFWLNETQPQVLPVIRFGIAEEKQLQDINGNPIGEDIPNGLKILLDAISEAENLAKVRQMGFELPTDLLVRRILITIDGQTELAAN